MSANFVEGDSLYKDYINIVNRAVVEEDIFNSFKSNTDYIGILEHVNPQLGYYYLLEINKYSRLPDELWHKVLLNDKIGNPNKFMYDLPVGKMNISPTTLRYIKFSLDIIHFIKNKINKNDLDIVEIGGGYGGLCKVLLDISEYFNVNISSYTIYDLDAVSKLSKKYLDIIPHGKCDNIRTGTLINCDPPSKIDLVLAFYSYSEISEDFRKLYCDFIINNSEHGYLCWNCDMSNDDIKNELSKDIVVEKEVPLTGQFNRMVYW